MARERASSYGVSVARRDEMTQARITLADIDGELMALGPGGTDGTVTETADVQAERQQIAAAGKPSLSNFSQAMPAFSATSKIVAGSGSAGTL